MRVSTLYFKIVLSRILYLVALRRLKIIEPYLVEQKHFDVWVEANGPEFIELDEILDRFVDPSSLLQ
jgi:hypothetical protein